MRLERLFGKPIITPELSPSISDNINGATLIRVPQWVGNPLGKYYLYFSHHRGTFIRLAYADDMAGPWKIYEPGVLNLKDLNHVEHSPEKGKGHVASPDIYIDTENKRIIMYYHATIKGGELKDQVSYAAVSGDGLAFKSEDEIIGRFYWRVFKHNGYFYSLAPSRPRDNPSVQLKRSVDCVTGWEDGPEIFSEYDVRHLAVKADGDTLYVFFTIRGACPESINVATVDISEDWSKWKEGPYQILLEPETDYEGVNLPLTPSELGPAKGPERHLRDPYVFSEESRDYILYSAAGESSIAIAELFFDKL